MQSAIPTNPVQADVCNRMPPIINTRQVAPYMTYTNGHQQYVNVHWRLSNLPHVMHYHRFLAREGLRPAGRIVGSQDACANIALRVGPMNGIYVHHLGYTRCINVLQTCASCVQFSLSNLR